MKIRLIAILLCLSVFVSCKKTTETRFCHGLKYNWTTATGYGSYVDHTPGKVRLCIMPVEPGFYVIEYMADKKEVASLFRPSDFFRYKLFLKLPDGTMRMFSAPTCNVLFIYDEDAVPSVEMSNDTLLAELYPGQCNNLYDINNEIIVTLPPTGLKTK